MLKEFKLIAILTLVTMTWCNAQQFQITNLAEDNGKITVSFKIDKLYPKERYAVQVYGSHNDYSEPLQYVTGNIEGEIESSDDTYQVVWDAKKELITYAGQIQLELRGEVVYLPIRAQSQSEEIRAKHNKSSALSWIGGGNGDQVRIDLMKSGVLVKELARTDNSGAYNWTVDSGIAKGKSYSLRFSNLNNDGESYETGQFKIAGKTSPLVWILPIAAGGGVAAFLLLSGGDDDPGGNGGRDNLPDPLLPPGGN